MPRTPRPWRRGGEGGHWYAKVGGRQVRLADRSAGAREAMLRLREAIAAQEAGVEADATVSRCVYDYLDAREADLAAGLIEPETLAIYARFLNLAAKRFEKTPVSELRPTDVERWLAEAGAGATESGRPWGRSTRALVGSLLRACLRWSLRHGLVSRDPLDGLRRDTVRVREEIITPEQGDALVAAADPAFADFLLALRLTGCRPIEARTLTADRVDLAAGTWEVRDKVRRKTGRDRRVVYLGPRGVELTRRRLEGLAPDGLVFVNGLGRPWTRNAVVNRMGLLRRRLGYGPEATAYAFRHLFATDMLVAGHSAETVAKLMGHVSTAMVLRVYSKLGQRSEHLRGAMEGR